MMRCGRLEGKEGGREGEGEEGREEERAAKEEAGRSTAGVNVTRVDVTRVHAMGVDVTRVDAVRLLTTLRLRLHAQATLKNFAPSKLMLKPLQSATLTSVPLTSMSKVRLWATLRLTVTLAVTPRLR